ncbi:MAG TPA: SDR family oxidoreductase [Gammaproteobacteria bacterium]|nr:SDR family oxidoreductase [Gammaproteobacteria bacterium]
MISETQKRAILITGCSSGIGHAVAVGLQQRGYRVFATARKPADVARLGSLGLESLPLDLTDSASIRAAIETVLDRTGGRLYGLFNNGGYGQPGAVEDLSRQAVREQFETNLFGWMELTNLVLPVMRRQGEGRIIQNSSILGFIALKYRGAYNASKFAVEGWSDTLRLELWGSNIFVSLVEPGPIESRFRPNAYEKFKKHINASASIHRETYARMEQRFQTEGPVQPFTLPPQAVLKKVIHALESSKPRARYPVTFPSHLFAWLKRILPAAWLDRLLVKI